MGKYIIPPSNISINPVEKYENNKWIRIDFFEVKKGDLLRCFDHEYKIREVGTPNNVVRATTDCFEQKLEGKQIPTFGISLDNIPDL